jgi:Dolichyl-phosphate-mannose-protein mannosyltransferase
MNLRRAAPAGLIFIGTALVFLVSPVRVLTDSRYSPLVAEAVLQHGSLALDPWFPRRDDLPYQVEHVGGHVYSWYPPGGPVMATPFVGILKLFGLSASRSNGSYDLGQDVVVQALIAALLMAFLAVLFYQTACEILPPTWSGIVALGAALGTQIWTTASRALWGDTFFVLLLGLVIWHLVRQETRQRPVSPTWLATILAWAYFSRPTAIVAVVAVTLYVARYHRGILAAYVATGLGWLAAFLVWSWQTFGSLLPTYYRMGNTFSVRTFGSGLLGILVSPSRGQLVFVPVTLFVAYLLVRYARSLPLRRLLAPTLIGAFGHLALIAMFPLWHGGHSYGPRYLTPLVPWLVLLAAVGLRALLDRRARTARFELTMGALLLLCSVLVQSRGALARETWIWNAVPDNISLRPERVWNWRDAQPLAGLVRPPMPGHIAEYVPGTMVDMAAPEAEPYLIPGGWSGSEGTFRWTDGHTAELGFALARNEPLTFEMELKPFLTGRRVHGQRVRVELNGKELTTWRFDRSVTQQVAVALPPEQLARVNRIALHLPDSAFASPFGLGSDPRQLGVALHWFRLRR